MFQATANNFQELTSDGVVLVDFYADWCGPCRALAPILNEIKGAKIVKVNVDVDQELARQFNVHSIPKLVLMKDGQTISEIVGLCSKSYLQEQINAAGNQA